MKARAHGLVGAVYLAFAIAASPAMARAAEPPPVIVGEVGTRILGDHGDVPKTLRHVLERELEALVIRQPPRSKRFVLSASLVKLEHQVVSGNESVACAVSVVLREQKSGAIRAILEGRAMAVVKGSDGEAVAIEAAARAAVASLPDAVRAGQ